MNKKKLFIVFFKRGYLINFISRNKLKYNNTNIIIHIHNHSSPCIKKNNIINNKK